MKFVVVAAVEVVAYGLDACSFHVVVDVSELLCAFATPGACVVWVDFVKEIGSFFQDSVNDLQKPSILSHAPLGFFAFAGYVRVRTGLGIIEVVDPIALLHVVRHFCNTYVGFAVSRELLFSSWVTFGNVGNATFN